MRLRSTLWLFSLLMLGLPATNAWALAQALQRPVFTLPMPTSPYGKTQGPPNTQHRFDYIHGSKRYTGRSDKPCVEHGQARCMGGTQKQSGYQSRYTNPLSETKSFNPRLHNNYKFQSIVNRQNF